MKVYVDADNFKVYTEENIGEEITQRIEHYDYDLLSYLKAHFDVSEIFAMLPPNVQSNYLETYKKTIIDNEFYEQYIDEPLPCDRCPFAK